MELVTKSGTEYQLQTYEENYTSTGVSRYITFDGSIDIAVAIPALTEDELSQAQIVHATGVVNLPPLKVIDGYRNISANMAPISSISLREVVEGVE